LSGISLNSLSNFPFVFSLFLKKKTLYYMPKKTRRLQNHDGFFLNLGGYALSHFYNIFLKVMVFCFSFKWILTRKRTLKNQFFMGLFFFSQWWLCRTFYRNHSGNCIPWSGQKQYIHSSQNDKIKKMSTLVSFSNPWSGSYDHKHNTWKHHEAQFLGNKMLKDEIKKIHKKSIKNCN
jgi:hypothetical protein